MLDTNNKQSRFLKIVAISVALICSLTICIISLKLFQKNNTSEKSMILAPAGKEVRAKIKVMSMQPSTSERLQRSVIERPPGATHIDYPVYYGTDRLPASPFGELELWDACLLFGAWFLALVSALLLLIIRQARWPYWISTLLLIVSFPTAILAVFGDLTAKENRYAAGTFRDGRGELRCGICTVSIPCSHQSGELEAPCILRFEFREDPERHIILQRIDPCSLDDFSQEISDRANKVAWPEAMVFVHGYNVTFEDAARRTAQLAHDIKFGGIAALFSWPSNGHTAAYTWDEQSAEYAVPHLRAFLELLAQKGNLKCIHVIAHSMGNRCVLAALRKKCDLGECRLDQCVFAAPDVDREQFSRDVKELNAVWNSQDKERRGIDRMTLYASSKDHALMASEKVHRYSRAGDAGPGVLVTEGLESIDATFLDTDYLGHSYFSENTNLINDLRQMIEYRLSAANRSQMYEKSIGSRKYWVFRPSTSGH